MIVVLLSWKCLRFLRIVMLFCMNEIQSNKWFWITNSGKLEFYYFWFDQTLLVSHWGGKSKNNFRQIFSPFQPICDNFDFFNLWPKIALNPFFSKLFWIDISSSWVCWSYHAKFQLPVQASSVLFRLAGRAGGPPLNWK